MNHTEEVIRKIVPEPEQLLWTGQPHQGLVFGNIDRGLILYGILWLVASAAGAFGAAGSGHPLFAALVFVPAVVLGLFILFGRFWMDSKRREKTFYGVTDKRALIVEGPQNPEVTSFEWANLSEVSLLGDDEGRGTISFGPPTDPGDTNRPKAWQSLGSMRGNSFELIDQPKKVYGIIEEARKKVAPVAEVKPNNSAKPVRA